MKNRLVNLIYVLGAGFLLCVLFSPRISYLIFERGLSSRSGPLEATPHDCTPFRDGIYHTDGIRCTLEYSVSGQVFSANATTWKSISGDAFGTLTALHRRLDALDRGQPVAVDVDPQGHLDRPYYVPQEWLAFPATILSMFVYMALFAALFVVASTFSTSVARRTDYDYDEHGQLVRVHFSGEYRRRFRRFRAVVLWLLLLIATLYAWSNSPANRLLLLGRPGLVQVPAILANCGAHYRGASRSGHDQIECEFSYQWQGNTLRGHAEALDFRLFPTAGRLDDASYAVDGRHVTAHVDPLRPAYAIAFISDDAFMAQNLGLGDFLLILPLVAGLGFLIAGWRAAMR